MYDLIVIGKGPAGLSAAIYGVRAGLSVLVLGRDAGALQKADRIENYLGFTEPVSGETLLAASRAQAERLGVSIETAEVIGINWQDHFSVQTSAATHDAISVILATGMPRKKSNVKGLAAFEGKGVSYCATCDAFFYKEKSVAVIGNGDYALQEARELKPFARKIHLLTNGRPYEAKERDEHIEIDDRKIDKISGEDIVQAVLFSEGDDLAVDGVFIAEGTASALDLALKLGLENDGQSITIDPKTQGTNLPGVFAAGDCTGGLLQVAVAVGEGASAGLAAASFVKESKGEKPQKVQW